ncbi:uncharacterized protein LOC134331150 [Trichomycterus rosablanca]|uniref:uncharacterized protein LOC134331150 n=1 Tax=Trichomycterus rosablanca TaxID=2290929 RepID=UPI002F35148F
MYFLQTVKPKRPVITSVKQTKNENFYITWKTDYQGALFEELIPELTYSITGSNTNETKPLRKGLTSYEIVGRNLQPSTNYTVWARVKCDLNQKFSDYSEPYMFKTPSSIQDILKIIIPVLCILLIIFISTMFYCYHKILSEWWDKVPTPKIAANVVKQVPNLLSFQNEFSPVHLDSSKPDRIGEKIWIGSSQFDIISQTSLQSLGKDGDSSQVIYAQTGYESVEGNSSKNDSQCEFEDEYHSTDLPQTVMSYKMYKHLQPNTAEFGVQNEGKKCSDIENKTYIKTLTDHFNQRNVFFPTLFKNLNPQIETDFGYGPCTGCLESTNTGSTPVHNTPFVTQTTLVPGYQSVTEVMDCGNKSASDASVGQTFLRSREDVDLIMKKLMCNKKPQDVLSTAWEIIPVESEYKDVQSLCMNTEEQHSATVKPSLQIFPSIEIDCSYHRV